MTEMFWGFPISLGLYHRACDAIERTKTESAKPKLLNQGLAEIVRELLQEGLQAYVYRPAGKITMGSAKRSAMDSGGKVVAGAVNVVINQFFGSLELAELRIVADYIDGLLCPPVAGEAPRLMFALEPELQARLCDQLVAVRAEDAGEEEVQALTASLKEVVNTCIDHYYKQPVDLVGLRGMRRSGTDFAMRNVKKAFDSLLERLLSRLNRKDLDELVGYLETLLDAPRSGATKP